MDAPEEFSVLFGFEFERTFKTQRKIHVEYVPRSYDKNVVVEQGTSRKNCFPFFYFLCNVGLRNVILITYN